MNKEWTKINIEYWTTNEKDWKRIAKKISKPLKGHLVDECMIYVNNNRLMLKTKKWWEFWKLRERNI